MKKLLPYLALVGAFVVAYAAIEAAIQYNYALRRSVGMLLIGLTITGGAFAACLIYAMNRLSAQLSESQEYKIFCTLFVELTAFALALSHPKFGLDWGWSWYITGAAFAATWLGYSWVPRLYHARAHG